MTDNGETYRRADDVLWRRTAGGVLVVSDGHPEPVHLTGVDELVFRLLARPHSAEELQALFQEHHEHGEPADATAALSRLKDAGLAVAGGHP